MRRPITIVSPAVAALIGGIGVPSLAPGAIPGPDVASASGQTNEPSLLARVAGLLVAPSSELGIRESGLLKTTAIGWDEPGADANLLEFASFQAMVDELGSAGVEPERIIVAKWWAEDADDRMVFVGHGIRVPGADSETVLDAFLSWVTHECCPGTDGAARLDEVSLGGREALAVSFSGDDHQDVDYILAAGDSAIWLDADAKTAESIFATLA